MPTYEVRINEPRLVLVVVEAKDEDTAKALTMDVHNLFTSNGLYHRVAEIVRVLG